MRMFQRRASTTVALAALLMACGTATGNIPNPGGPVNPGNPDNPTAARYFLPTDKPENVTEPTIVTDAGGGSHLVYARRAIGDAFYAYCPADCASRDRTKVVRLETEGTVTNAMIALDPGGRPSILMDTSSSTYYATCAGDCTQQDS